MSSITDLIKTMSGPCTCGLCHETAIEDVRIGSGLVHEVGAILKKNGFPRKLLLVADQNTLRASVGILESLTDFDITLKVYEALRVAKAEHVEELEALIRNEKIGVLSVGTGSVNDPCRLASARQNKKLCIFATAPSMDGFASYSSPIVANGFKASYPAKSPGVIIGDTKILADAPNELKSAGFGDMIAKYTGLVDWKISHLLTGEIYCERVAELTRAAATEVLDLADKMTLRDEHTAGKIFEALLKTGLGMSFMKNSRPASGAEHIVAHLIECIELQDGIIPNLHGDDVGVATLELLRLYERLAALPAVTATKESVDWEKVYAFYGPMQDEVKELNHPDNIIDAVDPAAIEAQWSEIVKCIRSVPTYEVCLSAMTRAGCKTSVDDIGKDRVLFDNCVKYSPFMRRRLTLLRMSGMIKENPIA
ncbi:MAG: iron-containing alcohol dehydrogenase [Clostridia bacterium]|nr:iron-containing alcohol dehydrogenase [Clostridia bacterium]